MKKIGFLGAGKMASAIAAGILKNDLMKKEEIVAGDVSSQAAANFTAATGAECVSPAEAVKNASVVILAVKPQHLAGAVSGLPLEGREIISIVAGVDLARLHELTGAKNIVRVMPNTPAMYGCGVAAYAPAPGCAEGLISLADAVFNAVGRAYRVDEKLLNAVTGLSGSGPAYVFAFLQALADGGVAAGLPRDLALDMAIGTVLGSAVMARESKLHPDVLKDMVTSPAGTTSRALEVLERAAFTGTVMQAVRAAAERSEEMGRK